MNMMKKASKSVVGVESDGGPSPPPPPPKRSSQCPPLVVAPAHGTLRLVPLAPPTGNSSPSSGSSSSTRNSYLMEVDGRRRPVQITADPRVYRGSVFANRRLANNRVSVSVCVSSNITVIA
uniref:Uncharacterized protein n=1 Tax=Caenorhabditis japonica TaxID=281687 RepID=A0A8R1EQD4_CAEJA